MKINSVRKWEQAFRIYAAIYMRANPERASEVWQYVYVINMATLSYHWDNVAYYDVTFRQLMAFKPWRSWAKTYVQGWNLAMRDPINRHNNNNSNYSSSGNKTGSSGAHDWCDDCCWRYNKNWCKKPNCNFDHRCTYCGGWGHGFFNCRKRLRKSGSGDDRSGSSSGTHLSVPVHNSNNSNSNNNSNNVNKSNPVTTGSR